MLNDKFLSKMIRIVGEVRGVYFAALIGSLVERGEAYHDIDVAVKVDQEDKYLILCKLVENLSKGLGVSEEKIDIIDLDRADLELKREVIMKGKILLDKVNYRGKLINELNTKYAEYEMLQKVTLNEWIRLSDPSTINLKIVKRRIDFAKAEIFFLKENILSKDIEEVESSPIFKRLIERSFHLILEAFLDVCRHITSVMGWGPALSYSDYVEICFKHGVVDKELKEKVITGIRLRNIIIHRYLDVDYKKLYEESKKLEDVVKKFERQILDFIKKVYEDKHS